MSVPTVNPTLTSNRPSDGFSTNRRGTRSYVENDDYSRFIQRIIAALSRRIATGDIENLPALAQLADHIDTALTHAVHGLRAHGYSWAEIADRLHISRQAAHQRWNTSVPTSTEGGAA